MLIKQKRTDWNVSLNVNLFLGPEFFYAYNVNNPLGAMVVFSIFYKQIKSMLFGNSI